MNTVDTSILVVDDDPDVLFATARILKNAGYAVIQGTSGKEALSLSKHHQPDLILLDAVMPDISGIDVLKKLKKGKQTRQLSIILISSLRTGSQAQSEGMEAGADQYIARPIPNRELLARIRAFLRLKSVEKELEKHRNHLEELVDLRTQELKNEIRKKESAQKTLSRQTRSIALNNQIATIFLTAAQEDVFYKTQQLLCDAFHCQYGFIGYLNMEGDLVCPAVSKETWPFPTVIDPVIGPTIYHASDWCGIWNTALAKKTILIQNDPVSGFLPPSKFDNAVAAALMVEKKCIGLIGLANHKTGFAVHTLEQMKLICRFLAPVLSMFIQREKSKNQLKIHAKKLEEKNIALNVLLDNRDEDKKKLADTIMKNFDQLVFPYHHKLQSLRRKKEIQTLLKILEKNTIESLNPLERFIPNVYRHFTPMEIQVADLIKIGKSSKEIADLLNISTRSVFFHRHNIRKKLNIHGEKTNLRTILLSI